MKALFFLLLLSLSLLVAGDMYMHNPPGSNDRNNEANTNRNNANRLFDSQNNAKGGYCRGPKMSFYVGSRLTIEWTNQHGCGENQDKAKCDVIIQYMCSNTHDEIRDGTTTNTIPDDPTQSQQLITNPDIATQIVGFDDTDPDRSGEDVYEFGQHESYEYYQECKTRSRNKGLFIADRNVGGAARNTRQNNNGNRHGFECPEERDYYPYWHPTPWKDIAVLTSDTSRCDYYKEESQNVKDKNYCTVPQFNTRASCTGNGGEWKSCCSHNIDPPVCDAVPWSRDNHLGNGVDGFASTFNWTIPDDTGRYCVLRLRYNISSGDYDGWDTDASSNDENSPISQDPYVEYQDYNLSLAIDTSQFCRTFQDRSHTFSIRKRDDGIANTARVFNVNQRGKRGNIVQTYPAVEYDAVPNYLDVRMFDYIHFQWTGCDTNPNGNDGEGTRQTDRSNIVQMKDAGSNYPGTGGNPFFSDEDAKFFAHLGQYDYEGGNGNPEVGPCLTYEQLDAQNDNQDDIDRDPQNCMKLNAATRRVDGGLMEIVPTQQQEGRTYHFMSSRNNNFTNRSQKHSISIVPFLPVWAVVLVVLGAALCLSATGVATIAVVARALPGTKLGSVWLKIT